MSRASTLFVAALLLAAGSWIALLALGAASPGVATDPAGGGGPAPSRRHGEGPASDTRTRSPVETRRAETTEPNSGTEPASAGGPGLVTVRTCFEDGTPVPWVIVELVRPGTSGYAKGAMQAVTDPDGTARFADVGAGDWIVRTDRFLEESFTVAGDAPPAEILLTLPRGVAIRGIVLDPAGVPVADAEIWRGPTRDARETHRVETRSAPVTRSRADGTFVLPGFGPEPVWAWLAARHSHHAPSAWVGISKGNYFTAAPEQVELRLRAPSHTLSGRVLAGPDGTPVAGARVEVEPLDAGRELLPHGGVLDFDTPLTTTTEADGTFRLRNLVAGAARVEASAHGHAPSRSELVLTPGVEAASMDLYLGVGHRTSVEVTDPHGRPLADVRCRIRTRDGTRGSATSDAAGRCVVDDLPAGDANLLLDRRGFRRIEATIRIGPDAQAEPARYEMQPLPAVHGRLLHADGTVLAGWWVSAASPPTEPGKPGTARGSARSREDGTFELFLSADEAVVLSASSGRGLSLPVELAGGRPVQPGAEAIDFVVPNDAGRGGQVTAQVEAGQRPWFTLVTVVDGRPATQRSGQEIQRGYEPDTGTLRLGPLPAGHYLLRIDADPPEGRSAYRRGLSFDSRTFELLDGSTVDLGLLTPPPHGVLRWVLRPGRGCTPREPRLQWPAPPGSPGGAGLEMLDPDLDGGALSGQMPMLPGSYELTFWGEGFLSETRSIDLAAEQTVELDLTLHAARRLPIRLIRPEGVDHATFEVYDPRGVLVHEDELDTDEARSVVRYPVLPLGRHDVRVGADGQRWSGTFEVRSLTPTREPLTFELRPVD